MKQAVLALAVGLSVGVSAQGDISKELGRFQGSWTITSFGGYDVSPGTQGGLVFNGDTYEGIDKNGKIEERGKIKLGLTTKPMSIDVIITEGPSKGQTQLGFVEIAGDRMRLALGEPGNELRIYPSWPEYVILTRVKPVAEIPPLPNPVLVLTGLEYYQAADKHFTRYQYRVDNLAKYPDELFAAAPELPPCGRNTQADRTWVDFFDQSGTRLNGFCALGSREALGQLWFSLETGAIPPSRVYIEMIDRKTNHRYKSNLAETTK